MAIYREFDMICDEPACTFTDVIIPLELSAKNNAGWPKMKDSGQR